MTAHRCESSTRKGGRCKSKATVYHRHQDGAEYLCCKLHDSEDFRPAAGVGARPDQGVKP